MLLGWLMVIGFRFVRLDRVHIASYFVGVVFDVSD